MAPTMIITVTLGSSKQFSAGASAAPKFRAVVARQAPSLERLSHLARDAGFIDITTARHETQPFVMLQARRV